MRYLKVLVIPMFLVLVLCVPTFVYADDDDVEEEILLDLIVALEQKVAALEAKLANVSVVDDTINGLIGPHFIFSGVNVHIRSGLGRTDDFTIDFVTGQPTGNVLSGLGNLVLGYNEDEEMFGIPPNDLTLRSGSHNLIIGAKHNYPSWSGLVAGFANTISDSGNSVLGGVLNTASGSSSTVLGGAGNMASGVVSSVSGGDGNMASGFFSSVSGGTNRTAPGDSDWVAGVLFQDF